MPPALLKKLILLLVFFMASALVAAEDGGLMLTWATEDGKHHYEKFDMVELLIMTQAASILTASAP